MPITATQLRRAAELLRYGPDRHDVDERIALIDALIAEAHDKETRP